jgi:hypothetical protein
VAFFAGISALPAGIQNGKLQIFKHNALSLSNVGFVYFVLGKMIAKTLCVAALVGSASAFVPAVVGRSSALSLRMGSNVSPLGKPI